jgi:UbiD family decarboxylase
MPYKDLREFLKELERENDLFVVDREVSPSYEIAAFTRKTSDLDGPALMFPRVKGAQMPVLGGLYSTRKRVAMALECDEADLIQEYIKKERKFLEPKMVDDGPVHEVIWEKDDIDLRKLPIITNFEKDAGPYITAGVQIAKDPVTGSRNSSMHRMLYLGPNLLTVYAPKGRQLGTIIARNEDNDQPTEIATVIGMDPIIPIASQCRSPLGTDELGIAGGMRGEPVEMVKCKTIDVEVPATAEIVIEGRTIPGRREGDGPFGEYPGTYSMVRQAPVVEVTAITMRKDAIYQNVLTGMPMTENHWMMDLAATAIAYQEAYKICPDIKGIRMTPGGTSRHHLVISIRKRHEYEARNIITALLAANIGIKLVVVVDEDIDVNDMLMVEWAVNTRVQAEKDVIILPTMYSPTLDPSAPMARASSKMGIDATKPIEENEEYLPVYIPGQDEEYIEKMLKDFMRSNKKVR